MIIQVYTLTSNAEEAEVEPKQEFGWTLGVGDGEGGLACCNLWVRKESDVTEQLNWRELNLYLHYLHLTSGQREGILPHPSIENWIKDYWTCPHPSEQHPVFPSVSLSPQEASTSLLSFSIRGQTDWKSQSQKTNQSDHMDHSLV